MKYFLLRIIKVIPIVLCITMISFGLLYISESDPAQMHFHHLGYTPTEEMLEEFRISHGLDQSLPQQYIRWWQDFLQGDLGESFEDGQPVAVHIAKALPYTISLAVNTMLFTVLISVPLGIMLALYEKNIFCRMLRWLTLVTISLPGFIIGLLLLYVLAMRLGILPVLPKHPAQGIVLPTLTLVIGLSGRYIRQIEAVVKKILQEDYIYGLRARGIGSIQIIRGTVLKNVAIELITIVGMSFGSLTGGAAIVETMFNWKGIGKLMTDSVLIRDIPMIQASIVLFALAYTFVNLFTDLLYAFFDPRIRLGGGE